MYLAPIDIMSLTQGFVSVHQAVSVAIDAVQRGVVGFDAHQVRAAAGGSVNQLAAVLRQAADLGDMHAQRRGKVCPSGLREVAIRAAELATTATNLNTSGSADVEALQALHDAVWTDLQGDFKTAIAVFEKEV
ncbi:hypothetical protein KKD52_10210 [Myxococcota bacterium]|nr:hypothetical protein [Myxococcota bacterium]